MKKVLFFIVVLVFVSSNVFSEQSYYRLGKDTDDWQADGRSYVTDSVEYPDSGVLLSAQASGSGAGYVRGIAYAEYQFRMPRWVGSFGVTVGYSGDDGKLGIIGSAGQLWVQYAKGERGDSFSLREGMRRQESIRMASSYYNRNGWMTIRIIAEGSQQIDVGFISIHFYIASHKTRIVVQHRPNYVWKSWNTYTYRYYYPGYHMYWHYNGYWVRYTYPRYSYYWGPVYTRYNSYLLGYYDGRRIAYNQWHGYVRSSRYGHHIDKWSYSHKKDRKIYVESRRRKATRQQARRALTKNEERRRRISDKDSEQKIPRRRRMEPRGEDAKKAPQQRKSWDRPKRNSTALAPSAGTSKRKKIGKDSRSSLGAGGSRRRSETRVKTSVTTKTIISNAPARSRSRVTQPKSRGGTSTHMRDEKPKESKKSIRSKSSRSKSSSSKKRTITR